MNKKLNIVTILTSIFITFVLIIIAVKFTLHFRPLYYFDINYLDIPKAAQMPRSEIIRNYDALIDYLKTFNHDELKLPTLPMSERGKIHFEDVKILLQKLDYILYFSLVLSLIGIFYINRYKDYLFLRYTSFLLIGIPFVLIFPLLFNFNEIFTFFHQLTFRNNHWLFDPVTDPIIYLLPERYFMHTAVLLLIIIALESILMNYLYHLHLKRYM
ncbi:TIGR01906 family membrane protein [Mycoplasmatota bacterium]|nr:TIGR01906 family membrane protein [Mycoplasmatota bacterium]